MGKDVEVSVILTKAQYEQWKPHGRWARHAPEQEETMFNYTVLGFAFIETFAFMLFGAAGVALFF